MIGQTIARYQILAMPPGGGVGDFGIVGLFIGPVVLAVTYTLLKERVEGDMPEEGERSGAE